MTKLNSSFMIGNVEIPHRTVLAPMAGVTNSAFRTIAKEFGAGLVVMEMISEKGLLYNNEKTLHMLHIDENEHPMSIQLFGGDAEGLKRAADFIQTNTKADIVDINMGCPVNKVVKNEAGAKWLKDPDKIYHIVKEVTSVLDIPLTVKMRTGWSNSDLAEENALAVMVGRAAMNNPYIFTQINHFFETGEELPELPFDKKLDIAEDHLKRLVDLKGEKIAVREFRGLAPHYLRGTAGAAKVRGEVSRAESVAQVEEIFATLR